MMRRRGRIVLLVLLAVVGCQRNRIALDKDEFTALLIDLHRTDGVLSVAHGVTNLTENKNYAYYNAVFEKHGIDRAQFDSCLYYYSAQTALFSKIYDVVIDSLNRQLTATNIVLNELKAQDSVNLFPLKDTLVFNPEEAFFVTEIDSIASGLYKFSATVQFDTSDVGKNNRITAFFLAERDRRDTIYRRDTVVLKDTSYMKGESLVKKTLRVKKKLEEKGVFVRYDTLRVRNVEVMADTIRHFYNWSQYVDSTYNRLVIKMIEVDHPEKLKNRSGKIWEVNLFRPYISRETERRLRGALRVGEEGVRRR